MKAGIYKTNLSGKLEYKSFYPTSLFDVKFESFDEYTTDLLVKANYQLGKLNGVASRIIDFKQFIASYVRKEALYSSQIEGTQATLEDILDAENTKNINLDVEEVVNYIKAINYAVEKTSELPLCNRLIKEAHYELMQGARGCEKNPGEFRKTQNWLGHSGSTLKNARYIPPTAADMLECMSDLEKYINSSSNLDELIKVALIHYQFETIHPFLDGNGRIGRILIILYLLDKKKLDYPCLYLSYFLKKNQIEYYERMSNVRIKDDYIQWINFFLMGIIETCTEAIECIEKLVLLREENKKLIKENNYWLLEFLEFNPIITAIKTSEKTNIDYYKVNRTILKFVRVGILKVTDESKKKRTYIYEKYVNILKE